MKIALFATCLADTLFPDVARATLTVLERLGHTVEFPAAQTCCGQVHVNTGYQREALPLIRRYAEIFEPHEVTVAPSGSCIGPIVHQHALVARQLGEEGLAGRAEAVAARTYELPQLLADVLGLEDVGACYPHRVAYHPDLSFDAAASSRRPAAAAAAQGCGGSTWCRCPGPTSAAGSAVRSR